MTHRLRRYAILGAALVPMTLPYTVRSQVQDLHYTVQDLHFAVQNLEFTVEDVAGAALDLAVEETETEVRIELSGDVLFDFDKADIKREAEPQLRQLADVIRQYPGAAVTIEGYTDAKGADAYNLALSQRRAQAVKDWLLAKGDVSGGNITATGRGEADPVAPNTKADGSDDPEGRQKNRRVEVTVKK